MFERGVLCVCVLNNKLDFHIAICYICFVFFLLLCGKVVQMVTWLDGSDSDNCPGLIEATY